MGQEETCLRRALEVPSASTSLWRPRLFRLEAAQERRALQALLEERPQLERRDTLEQQLFALLEGRQPGRSWSQPELREAAQAHLGETPLWAYGVWAYYPWSGLLVHLLDEDEFVEVRTQRNRYKITPQEQAQLQQQIIGVVGLSVGQTAALTLAMERLCGELRLADFDALELSNLNRLRAGVDKLGLPKVVLAARAIAEQDPYLKVRCFPDGLTRQNMDRFFLEGGALSLLVEECDSLDIKLEARRRARELRVPVVMDTNDRGMLDIERFDLEPERPLLHGLAPALEHVELRGLSQEDKVPYVLQLIGVDTMSVRGRASMLEIEQTVGSWPQLASSVMLGGALVAHACRRIALGGLRRSGRFWVDLDQLLGEEPPPALEAALPQPPEPLPASWLQEHSSLFAPPQARGPALPIQQVRVLVEAATLAPSGGNMQPWRWLSQGDCLYSAVDRARAHSLLDWSCRGATFALGAAAENLALSAWARDMDIQIDALEPGPQAASPWVVRHQLAPAGLLPRPEPVFLPELVEFLRRRETNRLCGPRGPLPPETLEALSVAIGSFPGLDMVTWQDEASLSAWGALLGATERFRVMHPWGHADFIRELCWTQEENEARRDGIDLATVDVNAAGRAGLEVIRDRAVVERLRRWGLGGGLEKMSRDGLASASALCMVRAPSNSPMHTFTVGRAVQRAWLRATGLRVAFQPVGPLLFLLLRLHHGAEQLDLEQQRSLRALEARLHQLHPPQEGRAPAFLFRLAVADTPRVRSLRRPIEEVWRHVAV